MDKRSWLLIIGQFLIAFTIILSVYIGANAIKQIKFGQGTIYVKGCAEKIINSDFVKWQGTIIADGITLLRAYEKIENDLAILKKYLLEQGVQESLLVFLPIDISVIYERNDKGYQTNVVESYRLNQTFNLASTDIDLVTKVSRNITSLIKEGLTIQSNTPDYFYLKLDELKINMLGEAAKDARHRAEELVSNSSGSRVGVLRSAQQGVFQITPAHSNSVSDYGECDTSSIMKRIKAVVTIEYAID